MSRFELSSEQQQSAFFPTGLRLPDEREKKHLVIEAGAGAGKTRVLTERVYWLLCTSPEKFRLNPSELILVTFSKAADEELRHRVEKEIKSAKISSETQQRILSRLHISTIDSLFTQIAGNLFPSWWEQTKNNLSKDQLHEWKLQHQRFPPSVSLVSESELLPEICEEILQILEQHSADPQHEIPTLDFILAGAFQSNLRGFGSKIIPPRFRGLDRIATAMLHENFLRENAPPLHFALERVHPSSLRIINAFQLKARELFHQRLMQGRMTHNDRMLFLYHLLCISAEQHQSDFFKLSQQQASPLKCRELIVDEYQDTNDIQHQILFKLIEPKVGRMVVVGDPKQSIYGFRSAHVGVFQNLKTDRDWKVIELTRNYRSHPALLPFINLLSELTFSYKNNRIPRDFHDTIFAITAQQTFVGAKSLDAGRDQTPIQDPLDHPTDEAQPPRILLLGASLNKTRADNQVIPEKLKQNTFASWALARELKHWVTWSNEKQSLKTDCPGFRWSDVVVLCETNEQVAQTQADLTAFGVPAIARLSRPPRQETRRSFRSEELGLLLGKWLCQPLSTHELAEILWNGWLGLSQEESSHVLKACSAGFIDPKFVTSVATQIQRSDAQRPPALPERWQTWIDHLCHCRTLVSKHFFSAWQLLRWGLVSSAQNVAMENAALALHEALEIWSIREKITRGLAWPDEFLAARLQELRLAQLHLDDSQNAVTVCTIHGAKGLEWPIVVFWPHASRERSPEHFVMKSTEDATYVKWLAEDHESASLIDWVENPHPPQDRVSISVETGQGEQVVRWSADLQEKLEQDFERQRVFYTAFTRAREMLIIMSPSASSATRSNLRDKLAPLKRDGEFDPTALKINGIEYQVLALFADMTFDLRKESKRGARPPTPWLGVDVEAQVKVPEWAGLVSMRDYSPAWIENDEKLQFFGASFVTENKSFSSETNATWIPAWLSTQHNSAKQSPWKRAQPLTNDGNANANGAGPLTSALSEGDAVIPASDETHPEQDVVKSEPLSSAEQGLRFHAFMEHVEPRFLKNRNFLKKILSSTVVREHELEIWSTAEREPSALQKVRGLTLTQRKVIDLYCVIDSQAFPRDLRQSPCLRTHVLPSAPHELGLPGETESLVTVDEFLGFQLDVQPHLYLVIDFKTGAPTPDHIKQMNQYLRWVRDVLESPSQQILTPQTPATLFAGAGVKPLLGIIYYSAPDMRKKVHEFSSNMVEIDKNAALLFIGCE